MNREQMINKLQKYCFGECETCVFRNMNCDFKTLTTETLRLYIEVANLQNRPTSLKTIKIKYFDNEIEKIKKISVGDWIDLRAAERVKLEGGDYKLIPLGVGMILPDGYEAHILPRSSTFNKFKIIMVNSMGIVDNSYSGDADEWKFPALALEDTVIEKGDRIAQFRIVKSQPIIEFEEVEHLNENSRGGIGSTGVK